MNTEVIEKKAPKTENEIERLEELSRLDLDYYEIEESLGDLTRLAAKIAETEISLVNLIDNYTQWTVSAEGLQLKQMPREESVCQYTILESEHLEIQNLSDDLRFADRDYVQGGLGLRYYYGIPLKSKSGLPVGVLCVLDKRQRSLSAKQKELLSMLAKTVMHRLEMIHKLESKNDKITDLKKLNEKIAHDLRNPVSGMIGVAELIEEEAKQGNVESILELASVIKEGGESAIAMVEDIMKDESANDVEHEKNEYNCSKFCDKLKELYQPQAKAKGVNLDISTSIKSKLITFSRSKLLQIVGNLVSNSVKFTPEGGSVSVELQLNEQVNSDHTLIVSVKDTGVGMEQDKVEQIAQGTAQSTNGTVGENGYGFGLTLVKHLLDEVGGSLDIKSLEHVGTEFTVTIPLS
jgi:signal transduction histidine kinase